MSQGDYLESDSQFGGERFSVADLTFVLAHFSEEWGVSSWGINNDDRGYFLSNLDAESGTLFRCRALETNIWEIALWWIFPKESEEATSLALEVLVSSRPPARVERLDISVRSSQIVLPESLLAQIKVSRNSEWSDARLRANHAFLDVQDVLSDLAKNLYFDILQSTVPSLHIDYAGGAVPFQSEGKLFGYEYYFRFRSGKASLFLGGDPVSNPIWMSAELEKGDRGSLNWPEFATMLHHLIKTLVRAPRRFEFPVQSKELGDEMGGVAGGAVTPFSNSVSSWGTTAEEAHSLARLPRPLSGRPEDYLILPNPLAVLPEDFPEDEPDFQNIGELPLSQENE